MTKKTIGTGDLIYVVTMHKNSSSHSYVLGVWRHKAKALAEGIVEERLRGGTKYTSVVRKLMLDCNIDKSCDRIIRKD